MDNYQLMEENIIENIKKAVESTGHPTSLKVSTILQKRGWFVKNSLRFRFEKDESYREIDVVALRESGLVPNSFDNLIIECKNNQKIGFF
jgi:hypothetical protein